MTDLTHGRLWGLRRMVDESGQFKLTAVDQNPPLKGAIAAHHGVAEAPWEEVARFKGNSGRNPAGTIHPNAA